MDGSANGERGELPGALPVDRLGCVSARPPSEQEVAAARDLVRAWDEVVAAGRPQREADYYDMAVERGIYPWFANWSPADSRWRETDEDSAFAFGATRLLGYDDNAQFGWLVPQELGKVLLVVSLAERTRPRGPTRSERRGGKTRADALFSARFGTRRGLPPDFELARDLHALVPWLAPLDEEAMALLHSVPGCEDRGFNVRAVHVQSEERGEWCCYEVYPLSESRERQNILAVIEFSPTVVFLRPQAG